MRKVTGSLLCGLLIAVAVAAAEWSTLRQEMVDAIRQDVEETASYIDRESLTDVVMQTMATVPRHEFVPEDERPYAYENRPLPIGYGQTISQPYIVALMTDLLLGSNKGKVLEIGTGSGYQAAVLAELGNEVYSIEIVEELGQEAAERLARLGYDKVHTRLGDGYYGWPEEAPFDGILVTAAASSVPPPLIEQLKPGGRMLIPIGGRFQVQQLMLIEKTDAGGIKSRQLLPVKFVPLTGSH